MSDDQRNRQADLRSSGNPASTRPRHTGIPLLDAPLPPRHTLDDRHYLNRPLVVR
jgi:hypothetical protein